MEVDDNYLDVTAALARLGERITDLATGLVELREEVRQLAAAAKSNASGNGKASLTPQMFTVDEAAELLHIGRATFYRLIKQGKILTTRIGVHSDGHQRISSREIERYLDRQTAKPQPRKERSA